MGRYELCFDDRERLIELYLDMEETIPGSLDHKITSLRLGEFVSALPAGGTRASAWELVMSESTLYAIVRRYRRTMYYQWGLDVEG